MREPDAVVRAILYGMRRALRLPLVFGLPLFWLGFPSDQSRQSGGAGQGAPVPAPGDSATARLARADLGRIRGSERATVWVVVMSDFECPFCRTWHQETEPLLTRDYVATGKVRLAYLNYIAVPSHRNAPAAHEAAMCAAEQNRFWPMAASLFDSQREWKGRRDPRSFFDSIAGRHQVDLPRFRACVRDGTLRPLIAADQDRVVRLGMAATPAFLIGGRRIIGAQPYEVFQRALDDALARAPATPR